MSTRLVRVTARKDFTFKGRSYSAGNLIEVAAIEAVQMGMHNVSYSRRRAVTPEPVAPVRSRRRKTMANPDAAVEVSIQANPPAEPASEDPATNTYERKDLRAED